MAEQAKAYENPFLGDVITTGQNRQKWSERDLKIVKRRLGERPAKRTKPYLGAPNFVVPVIDDVVREKTDQEVTMIENARLYAYFVGMQEGVDEGMRTEAQDAFDTYLRYIIQIAPKHEEALDIKNARGWVVVKVVRNEYEEMRFAFPQFGETDPVLLPDIEIRDPQDVICPINSTRDMTRAPWICDMHRYNLQAFDDFTRINPLCRNIEEIKAKATDIVPEEAGMKSTFESVKALLGLETAGEPEKLIPIFEYWHYATDWTLEKFDELYGKGAMRRPEKGRRARMLFNPLLPDKPLLITPWREADKIVEFEMPGEDGESVRAERVETLGRERSWEYQQCRYENRSKYFHDCRGVGHLTMDDQLAASATRNMKHVLMDYLQLPRFKGPGTRNTGQISHEPGSFLPEGTDIIPTPDIPASLDFTVDQFRRESARRCGAVGQYEYSERQSETRKTQKTATEIQSESMRGDMVSSASVMRFVLPWGRIYTLLWQDLRRAGIALPRVANMRYLGAARDELYRVPWLIIPGANAKTLSPDAQFARDQQLWTQLTAFAQMGVVIDPEAACRDMVSHFDRQKMHWIGAGMDPNAPQPVYRALGELAAKIQNIEATLQQVTEVAVSGAKLADELAGNQEKAAAGAAK